MPGHALQQRGSPRRNQGGRGRGVGIRTRSQGSVWSGPSASWTKVQFLADALGATCGLHCSRAVLAPFCGDTVRPHACDAQRTLTRRTSMTTRRSIVTAAAASLVVFAALGLPMSAAAQEAKPRHTAEEIAKARPS